MMGAAGPDIFFWAADFDAVKVMDKFYNNVEDVIAKYDAVMAPIRAVKDAVGEATDTAVGSLAPHTLDLIKQLLQRTKDAAALFRSAVATNLFAGVLQTSDFIAEIGSLPSLTAQLFSSFAPPFQSQLSSHVVLDEKSWYWFDMLHYRRSGRFAAALIGTAQSGTSIQRAYAYGYLSHIATDTVGHPYTNQVVGAPYRMDVQRHVVVENFMDAWAFAQHFDGKSVSKELLRQFPLPDPANLPDEVISLLDSAFRSTYSDLYPTRLGTPGFLSEAQIRDSYKWFHRSIKAMEQVAIARPQEPFSGVADVLNQALTDLLQPPPSPPATPSGSTCSWDDIFGLGFSSQSRQCYEEFFKQTSQYMQYLGELFLWTMETLQDVLDLILATLLSMPITVLLALLYETQLLLYAYYQSARQILVMYGFATPEPDDLNDSVGLANYTTSLGCCGMGPVGMTATTSPKVVTPMPPSYPRFRDLAVSHLVCPTLKVEHPSTAPGFLQHSVSVTPDAFIQNLPFDIQTLAAFAAAATPTATRELEKRRQHIGNASAYTQWMIDTAASPTSTDAEKVIAYCNWNLDSDRGYGYKGWTGSYADATNQTVDEAYVTS